MSKRKIREYACPNCGKEFELEQYESFTSNGELSDVIDVMNDSFLSAKCPHCGTTGYSHYPFIFNDVKNNFIVCHATSLKEVKEFVDAFDDFYKDFPELAKGSIRRIVFNSPHCFKEKVAILANGLNDKVVEIYKAALLSQLKLTPEEAHVTLEFSFDFAMSRLMVEFADDREEQYYVFSKELYEKMEKNMRESIVMSRYDDYIVDQDFYKLIDSAGDEEPKHKEMFRERKRVILVYLKEIDKKLYYLCDVDMNPNDQVFVPYKGKEYKGTVIYQKYLSEEKMGISFNKLRQPTKVRFYSEVMPKIYADKLIPNVFNGAGCFVYDIDVEDELYNQFIENEIIYNDELFVATLAKKDTFNYLHDDTRFVVVSNHPDDFQDWMENSKIGIFNKGYFKVLHKFKEGNKKYIILLHLREEEWIQFGVLHGEIKLPSGETLIENIKFNLINNTLDYDKENFTIGLRSDRACAIGEKNGKINIVKSYAVLD